MDGMSLPARMAARLVPCFQHPVHPFALENAAEWFSSLNQEPETMTKVIPLASRRAAPTATPEPLEVIQLHAQAHNALSTGKRPSIPP